MPTVRRGGGVGGGGGIKRCQAGFNWQRKASCSIFYPWKNALFSEGTMKAETHTASEENVKVGLIEGRVTRDESLDTLVSNNRQPTQQAPEFLRFGHSFFIFIFLLFNPQSLGQSAPSGLQMTPLCSLWLGKKKKKNPLSRFYHYTHTRCLTYPWAESQHYEDHIEVSLYGVGDDQRCVKTPCRQAICEHKAICKHKLSVSTKLSVNKYHL